MSYQIIKSTIPISNGTREDDQLIFKYKSSNACDLGRSFGRMFLSFLHDDGTPVQWGELLHMNDMFTESLWKNVVVDDYLNNVHVQSSAYPHLQALNADILMRDNNLIGGNVSNLSYKLNLDGIADPAPPVIGGGPAEQNGLILPGINVPINLITNPLDINVGYNMDDLNNDQFVRWGETLQPFAGVTASSILPTNMDAIYGLQNKAGLSRLKRQFLFGQFKTATNDRNSAPYIYKPKWCDMFDGKKSYWTNDIELRMTRGKTLQSVQYPNFTLGNTTGYDTTLKARGVNIHIDEIVWCFYVDAHPTIMPRSDIWTTDLRIHAIDSFYYLNKNIIEGRYHFALISIVKTESLGYKKPDQCIYQSGLNLDLVNGTVFGSGTSRVSLEEITFQVDHGDSVVQIPDNEPYRVISANQSTSVSRVDLMMVYIEYLKACGINPFNAAGARAKLDYMSFISQMMYIPVSMRKDRKYFVDNNQPTTILGCEANFNSTEFEINKFSMVVCGFRRVQL